MEDMDHPISPELPKELGNLLHSVGVTGDPLWTVRRAYGKIYLDLVWNLNVPAKTTPGCVKATQSEAKPVAVKTPLAPTLPAFAPVENHRKENPRYSRKKKSPSTIKRDKERYQRWLSKTAQHTAKTAQDHQAVDSPLLPTTTQSLETQTFAHDTPVAQDFQSLIKTQENQGLDSSLQPTTAQASQAVENVIAQDLQAVTDTHAHSVDSCYPQSQFGQAHGESSEFSTEEEWEGATEGLFHTGKIEEEPCCITCSTTESSLETGLKKCTGCRTVSYCSQACQKEDWPFHKGECKQMAKANDQSS